jgi:hypothetical protein
MDGEDHASMSMAEIVRAKNAMVAMFGYGIDEGHLEDSEDDDDDLRDAALAAGATLRAALADCNARSCGRCFKGAAEAAGVRSMQGRHLLFEGVPGLLIFHYERAYNKVHTLCRIYASTHMCTQAHESTNQDAGKPH